MPVVLGNDVRGRVTSRGVVYEPVGPVGVS
jgi:hypothetical protein